MVKKLLLILLLFMFTCFNIVCIPHYYVTSTDSRFFPRLLILLNSIHRSNIKNLGEIAVFDLGLKPAQLKKLKSMYKVKVCTVEKKHENILDYFQTDRGRKVRGWFAWKPVVIKQALEMYPYILYLDSGMAVYKPIDFIFEYIIENKYFLVNAESKIWDRITKYPLEQLVKPHLNYEQIILDKEVCMNCGGIQGLSRDMLDLYANPNYECAANLDLFADDGSSVLGFGSGRHDQTIFSIYARFLNLKMFEPGWNELKVKDKKHKFHIHWDRKLINENTCIYY